MGARRIGRQQQQLARHHEGRQVGHVVGTVEGAADGVLGADELVEQWDGAERNRRCDSRCKALHQVREVRSARHGAPRQADQQADGGDGRDEQPFGADEQLRRRQQSEPQPDPPWLASTERQRDDVAEDERDGHRERHVQVAERLRVQAGCQRDQQPTGERASGAGLEPSQGDKGGHAGQCWAQRRQEREGRARSGRERERGEHQPREQYGGVRHRVDPERRIHGR